jgi:hypothetical protein
MITLQRGVNTLRLIDALPQDWPERRKRASCFRIAFSIGHQGRQRLRSVAEMRPKRGSLNIGQRACW